MKWIVIKIVSRWIEIRIFGIENLCRMLSADELNFQVPNPFYANFDYLFERGSNTLFYFIIKKSKKNKN
jgi:hypothetical protein